MIARRARGGSIASRARSFLLETKTHSGCGALPPPGQHQPWPDFSQRVVPQGLRPSPAPQLPARVLSRPTWAASLALACASGAAGLAHQILWTRRLVDVLGASADTFSKVVGAFFVGLALGAWLASRTKASEGNWWRRVAGAELAVPVLFSTELSG